MARIDDELVATDAGSNTDATFYVTVQGGSVGTAYVDDFGFAER